jgi:hypothetical protein
VALVLSFAKRLTIPVIHVNLGTSNNTERRKARGATAMYSFKDMYKYAQAKHQFETLTRHLRDERTGLLLSGRYSAKLNELSVKYSKEVV